MADAHRNGWRLSTGIGGHVIPDYALDAQTQDPLRVALDDPSRPACLLDSFRLHRWNVQLQADLLKYRLPIEKFLANGITIKRGAPAKTPATPAADTIGITESLSRPTGCFHALTEQAGHADTDAFVSPLVAAHPSSGSSKLQTASKQATTVISEAELLSLPNQQAFTISLPFSLAIQYNSPCGDPPPH
jgi:hypothetical protein